jgi:hypothetical protein
MTEAEWLACDDPDAMLTFLHRRATGRKLRLFACACCRRLWHLLRDERSRRAVEAAERCADGGFPLEQLPAVYEAASAAAERFPAGTISFAAARAAADAVRSYPQTGRGFLVRAARAAAGAAAAAAPAERPAQAALLRDLFAPFRPAALAPPALVGRGETAAELARAIYTGRRFGDLPVLADALEEAGCTDAELLGHLRGPGPHARGCWALDFLTGRE